jgi:hypothetical protein
LAASVPDGSRRCRSGIISQLDATFRTNYAARITLAEALHRDAMIRHTAQATGGKYLITPPT